MLLLKENKERNLSEMNFTKKTTILCEAVVHRCSSKVVFLKNSQYLQESAFVGVSF